MQREIKRENERERKREREKERERERERYQTEGREIRRSSIISTTFI